MNFCPGELILELLARIGEWHQNLSEKTVIVVIHKKDMTLLLIILRSRLCQYRSQFLVSLTISLKTASKQESIPVGCVPPTRRPYLPGPGGGVI